MLVAGQCNGHTERCCLDARSNRCRVTVTAWQQATRPEYKQHHSSRALIEDQLPCPALGPLVWSLNPQHHNPPPSAFASVQALYPTLPAENSRCNFHVVFMIVPCGLQFPTTALVKFHTWILKTHVVFIHGGRGSQRVEARRGGGYRETRKGSQGEEQAEKRAVDQER